MTATARHGAFVYDADDEFAGRAGAFLEAGLAQGEATFAVVDPGRRELLRDALGPESERGVSFIDRDSHYTRPEAVLAGYDALLRKVLADGAPSVRVYGELPALDTRERRDRWMAYEAILNRAFAEHPVSIMCGYDARELPAPVLDAARRTHPEIVTDGWSQNPAYDDPDHVVRALTREAEPLPDLVTIDVNGDARAFREHLARAMAVAHVPEEQASNMLLAASEVLANAHRHGGGALTLRIGLVGGERFVCELTDRGSGLEDPMAGYLPPNPVAGSGAGLWVARQLTERLEFVPSARGLTVRLWV